MIVGPPYTQLWARLKGPTACGSAEYEDVWMSRRGPGPVVTRHQQLCRPSAPSSHVASKLGPSGPLGPLLRPLARVSSRPKTKS